MKSLFQSASKRLKFIRGIPGIYVLRRIYKYRLFVCGSENTPKIKLQGELLFRFPRRKCWLEWCLEINSTSRETVLKLPARKTRKWLKIKSTKVYPKLPTLSGCLTIVEANVKDTTKVIVMPVPLSILIHVY